MVNGFHHPTGVYDYGSTDHLLPYRVQAAGAPARGTASGRDCPSCCVARPTTALYLLRRSIWQAQCGEDYHIFLGHVQRVTRRANLGSRWRDYFLFYRIGEYSTTKALRCEGITKRKEEFERKFITTNVKVEQFPTSVARCSGVYSW